MPQQRPSSSTSSFGARHPQHPQPLPLKAQVRPFPGGSFASNIPLTSVTSNQRELVHLVGQLGVSKCLCNQLKIHSENPQGRTQLEMQSRNRVRAMHLSSGLGTKCSCTPPEGKLIPSGFSQGHLEALQEKVIL